MPQAPTEEKTSSVDDVKALGRMAFWATVIVVAVGLVLLPVASYVKNRTDRYPLNSYEPSRNMVAH